MSHRSIFLSAWVCQDVRHEHAYHAELKPESPLLELIMEKARLHARCLPSRRARLEVNLLKMSFPMRIDGDRLLLHTTQIALLIVKSPSHPTFGKNAAQVNGPHLILLPKSVLGNWQLEFKRFCPSVRVLRLSGNKVILT